MEDAEVGYVSLTLGTFWTPDAQNFAGPCSNLPNDRRQIPYRARYHTHFFCPHIPKLEPVHSKTIL